MSFAAIHRSAVFEKALTDPLFAFWDRLLLPEVVHPHRQTECGHHVLCLVNSLSGKTDVMSKNTQNGLNLQTDSL